MYITDNTPQQAHNQGVRGWRKPSPEERTAFHRAAPLLEQSQCQKSVRIRPKWRDLDRADARRRRTLLRVVLGTSWSSE
jgi:ferric-dicitrate binding protein FerR (iron transport regulator)